MPTEDKSLITVTIVKNLSNNFFFFAFCVFSTLDDFNFLYYVALFNITYLKNHLKVCYIEYNFFFFQEMLLQSHTVPDFVLQILTTSLPKPFFYILHTLKCTFQYEGWLNTHHPPNNICFLKANTLENTIMVVAIFNVT